MKLNLVGHIYNDLFVVEETDSLITKSGVPKRRWLCECICGKITAVTTEGLRSGQTRSCGCRNNRPQYEDLVGRIFGKLVVLSLSEFYGSGRTKAARWLCQCECGKIKAIQATALKQGLTISCGCHKDKIVAERNKIDIAGRRFGRLLVIERGISKKKSTGKPESCWRCVCDCGNETQVPTYSLTSDNTKSCGCLSIDTKIKLNTTHGMTGTREYNNSQAAKRRELRKALDTEWSLLFERCLNSYFPVCVVCGDTHKLATDHVYPLDAGYGLRPGNAVKLCQHCNSSKRNKMPEDLPEPMRSKILTAAESFRVAMSGGF